jgi:phospholipid transport system substrate-binding protein
MNRSPVLRRRGMLCGLAGMLVWVRRVQAATDAAMTAPIQRLNAGLLEVMQAGRATPVQTRFAKLVAVIDQVFDLDTILRVSVGSAWSTMPPQQQELLRQAFRRYTVASYVNSFDDYSGQRFEVLPDIRSLGNGQQVVQTRIIPRSGNPHELDYVMASHGSAWRVVDVLADGTISRVAVQRSDFRHLLARGGAAALAASLQEKSADLSAAVG